MVRRLLRVWTLLTLLLALAALAGCGGGSNAGDQPELVVFAAASLAPAFEAYGDRFDGADVQFSFAGSDELAAQIRQGVTPDVYAAANTSLPEELAREGRLQNPRTFATNRLVIGVPAGSSIEAVSDLEEPGTSIAIGDPDVPVGAYTRQVLDALGPERSEAILANVESSEPDVSGIVGKIDQGAVDAGFIYRSDVAASNGDITAVALPKSISPDVAYGIAVSADADQPELANEFVRSVIDGPGQRALLDAGFGPASGK